MHTYLYFFVIDSFRKAKERADDSKVPPVMNQTYGKYSHNNYFLNGLILNHFILNFMMIILIYVSSCKVNSTGDDPK